LPRKTSSFAMGVQIGIHGIRKKFGMKTAVSIDEINVKPGEIVGIVGNNGAGETTLFRLILDLIKADKGRIQLTPTMSCTMKSIEKEHPTESSHGIDPAKSEEWKYFTGAYIDDGFLIDFLTAEEYFNFIGKVNRLSKEKLEQRMDMFPSVLKDEILGQNKLIRSLSAGNKQKVGIVSAMLNLPQLLILDEPFNFLDPTSQNALKRLLIEYNRETSSTILISSHNLGHIVDISTRIVLLENGLIIRDLSNKDKDISKELAEYFGVD